MVEHTAAAAKRVVEQTATLWSNKTAAAPCVVEQTAAAATRVVEQTATLWSNKTAAAPCVVEQTAAAATRPQMCLSYVL